MSGRKPPATPLGEALEAYLKRAGLRRRLDQASVIPEWPDLVGEKIAEVATPEVVLAGGVLVVRVKSAAWANELQLMSGEILRKLGQKRKKIQRIIWRAG